jgi:hypothetical protein
MLSACPSDGEEGVGIADEARRKLAAEGVEERGARPATLLRLRAAAGENRRKLDQARPILLAAAGGESPHATAIWKHAAKDSGAPITSRIGEP